MSDRWDDRDFKEEPVDWRELKEFIVDQVKRAGQRIDAGYVKEIIRERGGNVDRVLDKLAEKGYISPSEEARPTPPQPPFKSRYHQPARRQQRHADDAVPAREGPHSLYRQFRKRLIKRVDRVLTGFRVHAAAFGGMSVFFFILWILTGFGHPWFLYPILAWGIGLANHLNVVVQRLKQRREVEVLPDLTAKETRYLRRLHRGRTGFNAHLISSASLSFFLIATDVITGGFFPWSLIPTAALAFGVFLHWSAYAPRARKMKRRIMGWIEGNSRGTFESNNEGRSTRIEDSGSTEPDPPVVREASTLRSAILRSIEEMEKDHPGVSDMRPMLDTYFQQVRQLATKSVEISNILADLPKIDLQQDRVKLKNRMDSVQSDRLRLEYAKSIEEVDKQLASITELSHNSEMLELRLNSAVNLMKQLQLDLARVKGKSLTSTSSFGLLKDKSNELSRYLEDLEAGYEELESDL